MTNNLPGNRIDWTPEEEATLRFSYAVGGINAAVAAIPGRSESSIYRHAAKLGIVRKRRWSDADDQRLRFLWDGDSSVDDIAQALGREVHGVYHRARQLDLLCCPRGWEHLRDAAARAGYARDQLLVILRRHGATIRRTLADPRSGNGPRCRRRFIVLPAEVDAAVAEWLNTETVEAAARRLGMDGKRLLRWLRGAGLERPRRAGRPKPGARPHWRVTADDIALALEFGKALRHDRRPGSPARSPSGGKAAEQRGAAAVDDRAQFVGPRRPEANPRGNQPEPARLGGRALSQEAA